MATYCTNVLLSCLNSLNFRSVCHSRIVREHLLCFIFILSLEIKTVTLCVCVHTRAHVYVWERQETEKMVTIVLPVLPYHVIQSGCWCNSKNKGTVQRERPRLCSGSSSQRSASHDQGRAWPLWHSVFPQAVLSLFKASPQLLRVTWLSIPPCFRFWIYALLLTSEKDVFD